MNFKLIRIMIACLIIISALGAVGCGILGSKSPVNRLLSYNPSSMGCLNSIGDRMNRYLKGAIQPDEWKSTWDCATDSLSLFERFVQGSDPSGYTQDDIRDFLGKFMLTSMPVTKELIATSFQLKASLFGGSDQILTRSELDTFLSMLVLGKNESTVLIPYLYKRLNQPTADDLLKFADTLTHFGYVIGSALDRPANPELTFQTIQVLAQEVGKIMGWSVSPDFTKWLSALKVIMFAGGKSGLEAGLWPDLFQVGSELAAPVFAATVLDSKQFKTFASQLDFYKALASHFHTAFSKSMSLHSGAISLASINDLIDSLPAEWLTMDRKVLKDTLPALSGKLLRSTHTSAFDQGSIDLIFQLLNDWTRGQGILQKIFDSTGMNPNGVTPQDFIRNGTNYLKSADPSEKADVSRLIMIAGRYHTRSIGTDGELYYVPFDMHTLDSLGRYHGFQLVSELIFGSYSSFPIKDRASQNDFITFVTDYQDLGFAMKLWEIIPNMAQKRYREMSLFMYSSNGYNFVDIDESTEYLATLFSANHLATRVHDDVALTCANGQTDPLGWKFMDIHCFRKVFFENVSRYWDHFPELLRFYEGLDANSRKNFQVAMEAGARLNGYSDDPIGITDVVGITALMHYLENTFQRFDTNGDGILDLNEVLSSLNVFRETLAQLSGVKDTDESTLQAILTFTMNFGAPPTKDILGITELLGWEVIRPLWNIRADRLSLYKVISSLTSPTQQ